MAGYRGLIFTSEECGLANRPFSTFQAFRPFSQEYPDSILVAQLIYLFIVSCMLHVTVTCTMLQKQVSVFSTFNITVK